MKQRIWVAVLVVGTLVAGVVAFFKYLPRSNRSDTPVTDIRPTSELEWKIDAATDDALPAGGYMLFVQESKKCNGAAVIKTTGAEWGLGLAWYDIRLDRLTDVIKRDELVSLMERYTVVDSFGLDGVRRAEDGTPEIPVGLLRTSGESVWLQLDPDSCGVRSGWLVYRKLPNGKVTRQRINW